MENVAGTNHRVRFKGFELDPHTRELYRNGIRLRVQGQPIDVLQTLLERPGELVTREQLRKKLWPEDTFVDFEHSLNSAVTRLREALGDKAESPKFIETLPRLGYRFVAKVENGDSPDTLEIPFARGTEMAAVSNGRTDCAPPKEISKEIERRPSFVRRWRWSLIASTAGMAVAVGAFLWYIHQPLPPPRIGETRQLTRDVRWSRKRPIGVGGGRVYFAGNPRGFFAAGASGEIETVPLIVPWPTDQEVWAMDVSPDGAYFLAFPTNSGPSHALWLFTTTGKPVRYLADVAWASWSTAGWSPDSKQVVYSTVGGKVYTVPITSNEPRLLFTSPSEIPVDFSWSPDGKRIRFDMQGGIWEVDSDGRDLHEFLPGMKGSVTKCCGRWTPDGAYYIFESTTRLPGMLFSGNFLEEGQLWAIDERSGKLRDPSHDSVQLTSGPIEWSFPVLTSPDSHTLFAAGTVKEGELVRFEKRTGQLVEYLGALSAVWLDFSPDGKYVAYISYPGRKLWRANRDGSDRIVLAETEGIAYGLHWSPDGTKVLFGVLLRDFKHNREANEVYVIAPHGGRPERVQFPPGESPLDPTWSPDGKRLAYTVDTVWRWSTNGIRILDLETHRSTAVPTAPVPVWGPRWSPDGKYIFCSAEYYAGTAVFDMDTQKWTHFRSNIEANYNNWAHDSRSVYFLSEGSPYGVYRISIPSGHTERIVDLSSFRLSHSGNWLGLDPEDHPLLLRDAGSQEIYALTLERK